MSNADRLAIRFAEESAFAVTPAGLLTGIATVSASDVDNSFNDATEDLSTFKAKQKIVVSGFTEAGNNGTFTVVSATENKMIVEESLTTEALGDTVTIKTCLDTLRFTGESFGGEKDAEASNEIRSDRQVNDVVELAQRAAGGLNFEMSYGAYAKFLQAALCSSGWSTEQRITDDAGISFDSSGVIRGDDGDFASFAANQWIRVSGATNSANNGYFKISSIGDYGTGNSDNELTVTGGTLVTEAAGGSITIIMGAQILNGTDDISFSIEKEFADLASEFALFPGMSIDNFNLDITARSKITGSFEFVGEKEVSAAASTATGTAVASPANAVMAAGNHVEKLWENMTSSTALAFTLALANNIREREDVTSKYPQSHGYGKVSVTGSLRKYFASKTLMDKFINDDESALAIAMEDGSDNGYLIELPAIKYSEGKRVAGSENSDIVAEMSWMAKRDSTEDTTIRIARFPVS
jgi:hypothetical protein